MCRRASKMTISDQKTPSPAPSSVLREVDDLLLDEIKKAGYYKKLWQSFSVLLPIKSVGVMGDARTYENSVAIRAVTSRDAMTRIMVLSR